MIFILIKLYIKYNREIVLKLQKMKNTLQGYFNKI